MPLGGPGIGDMGVTGRSGVVALLLPARDLPVSLTTTACDELSACQWRVCYLFGQ